MDNNFNSIYSQLTDLVGVDSSTNNFFASLKYRENGYKLVNLLCSLNDDIELVEGYTNKGLTDVEDSYSFKKCVIKPINVKDLKELQTKICNDENVESATVINDCIEIIIK